MSNEIQRIIDQVHNDFAKKMHEKYITPGKICDVCEENPAVRINRWGTIQACCNDCLNKELEEFNRFCREQEELGEEDWQHE